MISAFKSLFHFFHTHTNALAFVNFFKRTRFSPIFSIYTNTLAFCKTLYQNWKNVDPLIIEASELVKRRMSDLIETNKNIIKVWITFYVCVFHIKVCCHVTFTHVRVALVICDFSEMAKVEITFMWGGSKLFLSYSKPNLN